MTSYPSNRRHHVFWGFTLYGLGLLCYSFSYILLRNNPLPAPLFFAIFVATEVLLAAPSIPVARRNWTLTSPRDLIIWSFVSLWGAGVWIVGDIVSHMMPLADFSAIVSSGVVLAPIVTFLIQLCGRKADRRRKNICSSLGGRSDDGAGAGEAGGDGVAVGKEGGNGIVVGKAGGGGEFRRRTDRLADRWANGWADK